MRRLLMMMVMVALTATVFAEPHGRAARGERGERGERGGRAMAVLDLTDAQKTQAAALRESMRETVAPLREKARANREKIEAALAAGNSQAAGELMLVNHSLRKQVRAAHESFATQFAAILSAEQKAKWELLREMREPRGNRGERPRRN